MNYQEAMQAVWKSDLDVIVSDAIREHVNQLRAQLTRWRSTVTEIRDRERAKLKELEDEALSALRAITRANLCDEILKIMSKEDTP